MTLTEEWKERIDGMTYDELLMDWRNGVIGSPHFDCETGAYWRERMKQLRSAYVEKPGPWLD